MYGITKKLLKEEYEVEDVVLIESPFEEITRVGAYRDSVLLALTPDKLVIAYEKNSEDRMKCTSDTTLNNFAVEFMYSLDSIKITVFKRTKRQTLKVVFDKNNTTYFELGRIHPRKIFWKLWCHHINEIKSGSMLWPCGNSKSSSDKIKNVQQWTDKYLYLGSKRETEDQNRPIPIPGLGRTEEVKLSYFKPEHFEGGDQDSKRLIKCDQRDPVTQYDVFTYAGAATSNMAYTSLMTTVGIIGQF